MALHRSKLLFYLLAALLCLFGGGESRAEFYGNARQVTESGVEIKIDPLYSTTPPVGFLPVLITITNPTSSFRNWEFSALIKETCSAGTVPTYFDRALGVGARSQKSFELYVPLPQTSIYDAKKYWAHKSREITLGLTGYGIDPMSLYHSASLTRYGKTNLPFVGVSSSLYLRSWPVLLKAYEKEKFALVGTELKPANLSANWRAYAGFGAILFTLDEWRGLTPGAQDAVNDWVGMGGRLVVFTSRPGNEPVVTGTFLPLKLQTIQRVGLGTVELREWDGKEISTSFKNWLNGLREVEDQLPLESDLETKYTRSTWPLLERMPKLTISPVFLFLLLAILVAYFVTVGPINIKLIAGKNRRMLLFVSTPVISLCCSALLAFTLTMREGFGGWGYRTATVYLMTDRQRAFVRQEQTARTALIFNTGFDLDNDVYMSPIRIAENAGQNNPRYRISDGRFHGDWFSNRSLQSHLMVSVESTRAGLKLIDGMLFSTINSKLSRVLIRDANGNRWYAENVAAGVPVRVQPIHRIAIDRLIDREFFPIMTTRLRKLIHRSSISSNEFIALSREPSEFMRDTLPAIRWKESVVVFIGRLAGSSEG